MCYQEHVHVALWEALPLRPPEPTGPEICQPLPDGSCLPTWAAFRRFDVQCNQRSVQSSEMMLMPQPGSLRSCGSSSRMRGAAGPRQSAQIVQRAAQRCSRTSAVRVLAFQTHSSKALEAAASFPSPLIASSANRDLLHGCALGSQLSFRASWWWAASNAAPSPILEGADAYRAASSKWNQENRAETICTITASGGADAFVLFISRIDPAGKSGGDAMAILLQAGMGRREDVLHAPP
jgi:hypothetical protein